MLGREFLNGSAKGIVCGKVRAKAAGCGAWREFLKGSARGVCGEVGIESRGVWCLERVS